MTEPTEDLASDLLDGAEEISNYLGPKKWPVRRVYYAAQKGYLPVTHAGAKLVGSKRRLKRHFSGDDTDPSSGTHRASASGRAHEHPWRSAGA